MTTTETSTTPARRPGVVTFIGVILYVQAGLAAIAGISLLIWRNDVLDWLEQEGAPLTDGALTGTIIGEFIAAALAFLAAAGLMRGSSGWRLVVAIVQGIAMAFAVYTLIAHHVGGLLYRSVFTLFIGAFVLWALYANDESDRYFEQNG
jgi:hypothetical protein